MRAYGSLPSMFVAAALLPFTPLAAQEGNPSHAHIGHVATGFGNTPDGQGLLATAVAEAEVAATHAGLAARDPEDLDGMQTHAAHVLHAVDPEAIDAGPGHGYGVIRAANGVAQHIELAAGSENASDNVKTHATHIATSARNTVARAERMKELCEEIAAAGTAAAAAPLVAELQALADALVAGTDADEDGRVSWQEGEGGLEQAETHLGLMMRGEGMTG